MGWTVRGSNPSRGEIFRYDFNVQEQIVFCILSYYLMFIFVTLCVLFYCVCIAVLHTLVAGLLARSQNPEGPANGNFGTGFSWFPCVKKRMLRRFPRLQVATAYFSCSPPVLNFLDPYFIFMYKHYNHCHRATARLQLNILLLHLQLNIYYYYYHHHHYLLYAGYLYIYS